MLLSLTSIRIESVNNNMADEDDMEEDGYDGLSDVDEDSDEDFDFVVPVSLALLLWSSCLVFNVTRIPF